MYPPGRSDGGLAQEFVNWIRKNNVLSLSNVGSSVGAGSYHAAHATKDGKAIIKWLKDHDIEILEGK